MVVTSIYCRRRRSIAEGFVALCNKQLCRLSSVVKVRIVVKLSVVEVADLSAEQSTGEGLC